jgi:NADH dehydrogenase [ubiquinone] 1 alpha subcomplex assembly factor 7
MRELPLDAEIRRRIAVGGPMPVWQYMALCLSHPEYGYYMRRDPLGKSGDFTTAPEISQMFGELVGLWAAAVWRQMGSPGRVHLVELGPGRGTMMRDALRAAQIVPDFHAAVAAHLIEISPVLAQRQRDTLSGLGVPMTWYRSIEDVPPGPLIVIANEFFDALPVCQAIKLDDGWHERVIKVDTSGNLSFAAAGDRLPQFERLLPARVRNAADGACFEWRPVQGALELGRRLVRDRGAALVFDYGHSESGLGDTFQAIGEHAHADPLQSPGTIDLTAHVDFESLADAVECMGAIKRGPLTQGSFLFRLGIAARAAALKANAGREQAAAIDSAMARLTGSETGQMGELFKVIAFADPSLRYLPGFER